MDAPKLALSGPRLVWVTAICTLNMDRWELGQKVSCRRVWREVETDAKTEHGKGGLPITSRGGIFQG